MVCRQVCCQRPLNGGLGMPDLESYRLAERLAYLGWSLSRDMVWGQKVRDVFPRLDSDSKAEGRCKPKGATPFTHECRKILCKLPRSSDISRSQKKLYLELVVGYASDPLVERLGWLLEDICSQWNWVPGSGFLNNSKFSLTWRLARNALPLTDRAFKSGFAYVSDFLRCASGQEETALHAFYYCEWVRSFWSHVGEWTAHIDGWLRPRQCWPSILRWEACGVSRDPSCS